MFQILINVGVGFIIFYLIVFFALQYVSSKIEQENLAAFKSNKKLIFKDSITHTFIPDVSIESGYSILEEKNVYGGMDYFFVGHDRLIRVANCKIINN